MKGILEKNSPKMYVEKVNDHLLENVSPSSVLKTPVKMSNFFHFLSIFLASGPEYGLMKT